MTANIAFSPDGQHIAYIRQNDPEIGKYRIFIASLEGNGETVLRMGAISERPDFLAWSPRGDQIFYSQCLAEQGLGAIEILDVGTGKSHRFVAFKDKFLNEIHWSPGGRALFAIYRQTGANFRRGQIGFLPSTGGDVEPITRDTSSYATLTLSADGRTLATVLARSYASISVLSKVGGEFVESRPLLSQSNEFDEWSILRWSADGNLLVSNTGRLLKLGVAGKNQTQLLGDPSALIVSPSACGTNYLVLSWAFHGGTNSQKHLAHQCGRFRSREIDGRKIRCFPCLLARSEMGVLQPLAGWPHLPGAAGRRRQVGISFGSPPRLHPIGRAQCVRPMATP